MDTETTTREITAHRVGNAASELTITAVDQPGAGGANHLYVIRGFQAGDNPSLQFGGFSSVPILFQNGPIHEAGINGVTHEALLAIVEDRLESFQSGPYACDENALTLIHIKGALEALHSRTRARQARGVEGTHEL